jgi:hypothetical protein
MGIVDTPSYTRNGFGYDRGFVPDEAFFGM